jgi:Domain of unknown function (DUF4274)
VTRARALTMSMTDDEDDGLAGQRMIAWLTQRGPDDWHFVASKLNWDCSMDVIRWILDQRQCDKATAATMFWASAPDYYLAFPNRAALDADPIARVNIGGFDFTARLVERWNSGFYSRSSIAYTPEPPDAYALYQGVAAKYAAGGLPWIVNADIGDARRGTDVLSDSEYRRRYSNELARLLFALGTDIPHPSRMHGSDGSFVDRLKAMFKLN